MSEIRFGDHKDEILKNVQAKLAESGVNEDGGYTVMDGFVTLSIQSTIGSGIIIGGPVLPVIAVFANKSGRVYYFTAKTILPGIELD